MGFLPLLPSGGKSGKRMNYGISATSAIRWQKWQKDELWDFCHFCHQMANHGWQKWQKDELPSRGMGFLPLLPSGGKSGKRMNYGIFATSAIMWQKWQKDELWDFCHFCHQDVAKVAKVAKG